MGAIEEKFTIKVTDKGVEIKGRAGRGLSFTPVEALLVLDILKNEEERLRRMAQEASPIPLSIQVT